MAEQFLITASLDIPASSSKISQQLIQQVLPNVNSKNPLKIVASLNLNQTSIMIQKQLDSISSGLNFNIGNIGSQISNQLSSVAPSANSANQSIANFRTTLMQLDSLLKTPIAIKYDNSGQMNLQSTLENVKSTFAQFGKVTFNWFKDDNGSVNRFVANIKSANGEVQKLKYQLDGTNFKYIGGSGEDSGIYKLAQGIDNARVKYSGLLADFKSSNGQLTSGLTTQITNVQNAINGLGQTTSIDNVKNAFRSLQTEASKISANLNSTNSSFNKVNNAIQSLADMPNKIKNLEIALGNLKKPPVEISNELTKLKTLFTEITAIEQQQGTSVAWSEKYKEVSATVKSLESNIKTISNAEKANNSEIQKANEYYRQMKENVALIQTLQNRRTTANTSETAEIDRQIKNAQNRIKYEEQQIQKKNLYNEALQREVNTLRNVQSEHNKLTVAQAKDNATQTLTNLEQKWERQGVLVGNVKTQVEALKAQISGIKDLNGINSFNSQLGALQGQVSQNVNVANVNSQLQVLSNRLTTTQSKFQTFTGSMKTNAVSQFRSEITSVSSAFERVKTAIANGNVAGAKRYFQEASSAATKFRTEMVSAGNVGVSMFGKLIRNVRQFSSYLLSATTVMLPLRLIRGVIDNVKELDSALVNIQMATGGTYEETAKLVQSYSELGQKLGATTTEVADSSNEWLRQGVSIEDANTLIYDSMVLSKVGMIDSASATTYLTAVRKSYNTSVQDTIGIVDKLTAVDMQAAVSAGGIAEGLSRVANIASLSGISLNRLIGYITTVSETTQKETSEVGNSFKLRTVAA